MSLMAGIISYLPNDNTVRTKRIEASRKQLEWLNNVYGNEVEVCYIAQNYTTNELPNGANINIRNFEKGLGCGGARNEVLKEFYKSDYDWLLLMDDDTIIDDKYFPNNFMREIANDPDKFPIDAVNAVEPEYQPYKKLNYEDKANLTHYKFTRRPINSGSATLIMRNIKKYYNDEMYFNNPDANIGEGTEDVEFRLDWVIKGYTWYTMETWIRKSLAFNHSTIWLRTPEENTKMLLEDLSNICDRYSKYGLRKDMNGKIVWGDFNNQFNKSEKILYIIRNEKIEYEENTIPKEKPITKSKKLF